MNVRNLLFVCLTAVLTFSVLYSPQPLLPIFMKEFAVDKSTAALVTTVTLFPLSLSPIVYGYILERYTAKTILFIAIFILTILEIYLYFVKSFNILITIRLIQGLLIPGILTSLMTFISVVVDKSFVQNFMSYYIASTILGGFLGRFMSGLIAKVIGWRYSFIILGLSLIFSLILLIFIDNYKIERKDKLTFKNSMNILKAYPFINVYISIFCIFFVFASMLNFIPFRLKEISDSVSEFMIGLSYSGYIMGIIVSLFSLKLIQFFKSEKIVSIYGMLIYMISLPFFNVKSIPFIFFAMFIFCTGMFTVHSVASGYLNKISKQNKGIVNGMYVSFYYTGGVLGTFLPGYIYKNFGWGSFLISLSLMILVAIISYIKIKEPH